MPILQENQAEMEGVLLVANAMAVAARTAPKARGADAIETLIVYGEELNSLSQSMIEHGKTTKMEDIFARDAGNVLNSQAVVLIGLRDLGPKKPDKPLNCGACKPAARSLNFGFWSAPTVAAQRYADYSASPQTRPG